jgi:predicted transcriptional regulator
MPATQSTTSVTLSASVVRAAKRLARREKRSVSDVVADALNQYEASQPSKCPETVEEWTRFIEEVKRNPPTQEEIEADEQDLAKYGAAQAKRLGIKSDRDVFRICDDFRARRRATASRTRH